MKQFIDKATVVAEIKRRKELMSDPILSGNDLMIGERNAYFNLLSFLDTLEVKLEVKEVDFDAEWVKYFENRGDMATVNIKHLAKHFFELGLKAQKGE